MKIKQVNETTVHYIETDEGTYLRNDYDSWSVLMGESWETEYKYQELEALFQEYLIAQMAADLIS